MKALIVSITITATVWLAVSCSSKERPAGILDKDQMVHALTQIYIAEEKVRRLQLSPDSAQNIFNRLQVKVLDNVGVSDSILKKSIDYYVEHPTELQAIYATLVDSLNLMEQRASVSKEK